MELADTHFPLREGRCGEAKRRSSVWCGVVDGGRDVRGRVWDILIAVDLFRPVGFLFLFNHAKEEDWDFTFHIMMFLLSCLVVVSFQESLLEPGTWGRVGGGGCIGAG